MANTIVDSLLHLALNKSNIYIGGTGTYSPHSITKYAPTVDMISTKWSVIAWPQWSTRHHTQVASTCISLLLFGYDIGSSNPVSSCKLPNPRDGDGVRTLQPGSSGRGNSFKRLSTSCCFLKSALATSNRNLYTHLPMQLFQQRVRYCPVPRSKVGQSCKSQWRPTGLQFSAPRSKA